MHVFVAGGTGVIGRRLVPQLVARGHEVTATTTGPAGLPALEKLGARAVLMDGLDAVSVGEALEFSVETYVYCPDSVDQGVETIDRLAVVLRGPLVTLWWD